MLSVASILLVLMFLGYLVMAAALMNDAKGPDARLGMAFFTVFFLLPWWMMAAVVTGIVYFNGTFQSISRYGFVRALIVISVFMVAAICYFVRAERLGLPDPMDMVTCLLMPLGMILYLGWLLHPGWTNLAKENAHVLALIAIGLPILANVVPSSIEAVRTSPQWMAELKAEREKSRRETQRKEEEANSELANLRAQLAALPADCDIEQLMDLHVGMRPEVFRNDVLAVMKKRPHMDTDLAPLIAEGNTVAAFFLAYHAPKVTAEVAPAYRKYLLLRAAEFPTYAGAYPNIFARDVNGFETALLGARRVQAAGGDISEPMEQWRKNLEALPPDIPRAGLLREVREMEAKAVSR